jgi:hypothetical protein
MYNSNKPNIDELPSSKQLIKSTVIAFGVAIAILFAAVLPAEYGIDPTGVGRILGLTKMGEIKTSLSEEQSSEAQVPVDVHTVQEPVKDPVASVATQKESIEITLAPGEAAEVKMSMNKGDSVTYLWKTQGGPVNHDTHGENDQGESAKYSRGRQVTTDQGTLVAQFDGKHGWFWRNRTDAAVKVVLQVQGIYQGLKRVL